MSTSIFKLLSSHRCTDQGSETVVTGLLLIGDNFATNKVMSTSGSVLLEWSSTKDYLATTEQVLALPNKQQDVLVCLIHPKPLQIHPVLAFVALPITQ
jgi:hypothetical protein